MMLAKRRIIRSIERNVIMSVTVTPNYIIATMGSTINLGCTSTASSIRWTTSGMDPDFDNASFNPTDGASSTLTFSVETTIPSDKQFSFHAFTVSDGSSSASVQVFVVPSDFTQDDIVIVYGSDGNAYLLTEKQTGTANMVKLEFVPTFVTNFVNASGTKSVQFESVVEPASIGAVTCYILNMQNLTTG
jgi:hypothetical protein